MLEHFFAKYSLESPLRQYLLRQAERLEEEKEALRRELAPTLRLKETLDDQVRCTHIVCGPEHEFLRLCASSFDKSAVVPAYLLAGVFEKGACSAAESKFTVFATHINAYGLRLMVFGQDSKAESRRRPAPPKGH